MGPEMGATLRQQAPFPAVVHGHRETWWLDALVRMPVFPEVRRAERPGPQTLWMRRRDENKQPSGPRVSDRTKPVRGLGRTAGPEGRLLARGRACGRLSSTLD